MQVKFDSKEHVEFKDGSFHVRIDKGDGETVEAECSHILITQFFIMTTGVNFRIVPMDNLSELVITHVTKTANQ